MQFMTRQLENGTGILLFPWIREKPTLSSRKFAYDGKLIAQKKEEVVLNVQSNINVVFTSTRRDGAVLIVDNKIYLERLLRHFSMTMSEIYDNI